VALIVEITSDEGFQVTADFSDPRDYVNVGLLEVIRNGVLGG
jgi:hypothetical protein